MTTKYIQDIRKIAKTDEILKRLPNTLPDVDKASIGKNRGVALADDNTVFNPCQLLYSSTDGNYTFANLVDGIEGPRIQDGDYNHCTQVNTITEMKETGSSPTLKMILKPDGAFLPADFEYWWATLHTLSVYNTTGGVSNGGGRISWTSQENVFCDTIAICASISNDSFAENSIAAHGGSFVSSDAQDPIPVTLTQEFLNTNIILTALDPSFPAYFVNVNVTTTMGTYDEWVVAIGFPKNYSFADVIPSPPNAPFPVWDTNTPPGLSSGDAAYIPLDVVPTADSFQLAIDIGHTNLWKPNPDETTAPIKYKNGVSIVTFDFGPGYTRKGTVRPAKDGGFAIFETDAGDPIGNAYIYRRDRTLATVVPVAQMNTYLA